MHTPARRLVLWNLLEGLLVPRSAEKTPVEDADRLDSARAVLDGVRPIDVFVANEALFCQPYRGVHRDYAAMFGFPHSASRLYDGAWGNAICSRHPVLDVAEQTIHPAGSRQNRGALAAKIGFPEGSAWVATIHPHPRRDPAKRADDFQAFIDFIARLGGPTIFAMDANAISPDDGHDRTALISAFERFSRPGDAEPAVDRFLEAGRMLFRDIFPRAGLADAIPASRRKPTMPTALLGGDRSSAIRIDHVLASSGIVAVDGGPLCVPLAERVSDHYPVVFDFIVERRAASRIA